MIKNIKFWMVSCALMSMGVVSCIEEGEDAIAGKGTNEIRFGDEEFKVVTFKPFLADQETSLITIYRDAVSKSAIDKEVTFTIDISPDSLTAYNTAHAQNFLETDPAWYVLKVDGVTLADQGTFTFEPGEGAKTIHITLDSNPFNLSNKYAIPLVIKDASAGFETNERLNVTIVQTLPINKYDGVYEVTEGAMTDAANGTLGHSNNNLVPGGYGFQTYGLVTTGAAQCAIWDYSVVGNFASPIASGTGYSQYGSFSIVFNFDASTDAILSAVNKAGQPALSNGRYATLDPEAGNLWTADGIESCGYRMHQPSVMGGSYLAGSPDDTCEGCYGSLPRSVWAEKWEYLEPR